MTKTEQLHAKISNSLSLGLRICIVSILTLSAGARIATAQYGGGTGTELDPFLIGTAEHLNTIGTRSQDWDKHFRQTANIDLDGITYNVIAPDPMSSDPNFTGVYDGACYAIANLSISASTSNAVGLIGVINGAEAEIRDVRLVDPAIVIDGVSSIGALAGQVNAGTITGCSAENVQIDGFQNIGGLLGFVNASAVVMNCTSSGTVSGEDSNIGGLIGWNAGGTVEQCSSTCAVGTSDGDFASGFGGLVGLNSGLIENSYAKGSVDGGLNAGGLVGINEPPADIENCFASGAVTGSLSVGGLFGNNSGTIVDNSFWDTETSGQSSMCGTGSTGDCDNGAGKITAEMQDPDTFLDAAWDFIDEDVNGTDDIWKLCRPGEDYPQLAWEKFLFDTATPGVIEFVFPLDGDQEFPIVDTPATGTGRVQLDASTGEITWDITYDNLQGGTDDAIAAHFHGPAVPGQNADAQVNIGNNSRSLLSRKMYSLCPVSLTSDQMQNLLDGLWYVNIHTNANVGGEIRGQVVQTLDVDKLILKAGRDRSEPEDMIIVQGELDVDEAVYEMADSITVRFGTQNANEYERVIDGDEFPELKRGKAQFKGPGVEGTEDGQLQVLLIFNKENGRTGKYKIIGKKIDLSGLEATTENPLVVELEFGSFAGQASLIETDDDRIINNRRPMPLCLLNGVKDAISADKGSVRPDRIILNGQIAADAPAPDFSAVDVAVRWDDFEEIISPGGFADKGNGKYLYRKPRGASDDLKITMMQIDLNKCILKLQVKNAENLTDTGTAVFSIEAGAGGSDFSASLLIDVGD